MSVQELFGALLHAEPKISEGEIEEIIQAINKLHLQPDQITELVDEIVGDIKDIHENPETWGSVSIYVQTLVRTIIPIWTSSELNYVEPEEN